MSVLAVMDLMGGVVVRGVAGNRATYQAILSRISADAAPTSIARGLMTEFDFRDVYLADLDAIAGAQPAWRTYQAIADCGLNVIVDPGINDVDRAQQFREFADEHAWLRGVVVGLESVQSPEALASSLKTLGPSLALFSLDLKDGQAITKVDPWRNIPPETIVAEAVEIGFRRVIVLDLAAVGVDQGPRTGLLCRNLRERYPFLEIISGGGVRSQADIQALLDAGCDRVLVASALHDGRLNALSPFAERKATIQRRLDA